MNDWSTRRVRPDDVVHAAELAAAALTPNEPADWSVRAGDLEWDVEATVVHIIGALTKETLYLASRSTRFIAISPGKFRDATHAELVRSIVPAAQALANTAVATPPDALAYHNTGMTDAEGYLAMGCGEVLVHTWDACRGLAVEFSGSDDLAAAILARTFPWVETQPDDTPWRTLLWAFGRIAPPTGRASTRMDSPGCASRSRTGTARRLARAAVTSSSGCSSTEARGDPCTRRKPASSAENDRSA